MYILLISLLKVSDVTQRYERYISLQILHTKYGGQEFQYGKVWNNFYTLWRNTDNNFEWLEQ